MTAAATSFAGNPALALVVAPAPSQIFEVDCARSYQLTGLADFVCQIRVLQAMNQPLLSESFVITAPLPVHGFADPTLLQRCARVHAEAGSFELR